MFKALAEFQVDSKYSTKLKHNLRKLYPTHLEYMFEEIEIEDMGINDER